MTATAERTRLVVTGESRLALPRHIKLRHDKGRGRWVILAPERVFNPDEISVAILKLCDGLRTVDDISAVLAGEYRAPINTVRQDIIEMLQDLADKGVVTSAS